jgi:hypothetical protein
MPAKQSKPPCNPPDARRTADGMACIRQPALEDARGCEPTAAAGSAWVRAHSRCGKCVGRAEMGPRPARMFGVFCKPILAILLQRKHQTIIVHLESRISRVNSVASSRRQLTPFWKVQHATTECAN